VVIESEEELRVALERGGRLSFSKTKSRWIVYKEGPSGLNTVYVAKKLDPMCEIIASKATGQDQRAIEEVIEEKRVTERPIQAERIDRLLSHEKSVTTIGTVAPKIFANTVEFTEEDWRGDIKDVAAKFCDRNLRQMQLEHRVYCGVREVRDKLHLGKKIPVGDVEGMVLYHFQEVLREDILPEMAKLWDQQWEQRARGRAEGWWTGWYGGLEITRQVLMDLDKKRPGIFRAFMRRFVEIARETEWMESIRRNLPGILGDAIKETADQHLEMLKAELPENPFRDLWGQCVREMTPT